MVIEEVFAVIAEATRRDILEALAEDQKAVGQLVDELGVSQPTVSKHLRVLREAGVVTMRAQGQKRFYSINTAPLMLVSEWLDGLGAGTGALDSGANAEAGVLAAGDGSGNGFGAAAGLQPLAGSRASSAWPAGAGGTAAGTGTGTGRAPFAAASTNSAAPAPARGSRWQGSGVPAAGVAAAGRQGTSRDGGPGQAGAAAAVVRHGEHDGSVPQQITRSVGRAANKAADLLASLPAFRRRRD